MSQLILQVWAKRSWTIFPILLFAASLASAQTTTQISSDGAKTALANSLSLISGEQPILDVTFTGMLSRDAGTSIETTPATLTAKGTTASLIQTPSSAIARLEVWSFTSGSPGCQWNDTKGVSHSGPAANCAVSVWFFPQLSPLASVTEPTAQVTYVGHEMRESEPVDHYTICRTFVIVPSKPQLNIVSRTEIYLDSATQIPVALAYQTHPDNDLKTDLAVEVRFSDYRAVSGVVVPFRVMRLLNGATVLDFKATNVIFNSGVSDSDFALQ